MQAIKLISSATVAVFITAAVAQPMVVNANMIDNSQKTAESAQTAKNAEYEQMKQQQEAQAKNVQAQQSQFNNTANPQQTAEYRQVVYDASTGQMVTIVKNGYTITAYNAAGQQVPLQADWINQINQTTGTSNMSGSTTQQLATIASTIRTDSNLNTVGKLIKAFIALEAVRSNNQIVRQQYAKQLAQQKAQAQGKSNQTATTTPQKKDSPATKGKSEIEYASVLREDANQHGGTIGSTNIANTELASQSTETPLTIDLVGKIIAVNEDVLTIEDATGRKINVKVADPENYSTDTYLNATGTILSGSDGNLYVMQDPESGIDVQVQTISEETYNYKAEQQQAAAEQFAAEYPQAAGLAGTGANGQYQSPAPAPEEDTITEISDTGEAMVPQVASSETSGSDDSDDGPGILSQAGDWIMNHKMQIAGGAMVIAGGALVAGSGALTLASGATLSPLSALGAKVGYSMISGGIGAFALGTFNNYAEEEVERRHPDAGRNSDLLRKGAELEQEVQYNMTEANQN